MADIAQKILQLLAKPSYSPMKPRLIAKKLSITKEQYAEFRNALKKLKREGRIEQGRNSTVKRVDPLGTITGVYRRTLSGIGFVRPIPVPATLQADIRVRKGQELDAATGDTVLVKLVRRPSSVSEAKGDLIRILDRATRSFVGTYFERDGEGLVRVDGTVFAHSVAVGDPGAKGAKPQDKVQIEMIRFPTLNDRGEGVITEVFGPLSEPGVDVISIIRAFNLPEEFPEPVLTEARSVADAFREQIPDDRTDFTNDLVITIDPVDARDFDDAVSVDHDETTGHTLLTVHIADVSHFAPVGSQLDSEARRRGTSVYLPGKVIPMFPELISNGLASLQEGKLRYTKSVVIEYTPEMTIADTRFSNSVIRVKKRFSYEQVAELYESRAARKSVDPDLWALLERMKTLALKLRALRLKRGALELTMPEPVLDYDEAGRVSGAHFAQHDLSHQVIEEFMLAANEAVARRLNELQVPYLRRIHPAPNPEKLKEFASFAELLGYPLTQYQNRYELQRVLTASAEKPERAAIHYAMLRSLKQAIYSPEADEHYALASLDYCHFTSPIRRYPDLVVHRLLDRWIRKKKVTADLNEMTILGDQCSKLERRAEMAERELVKLKILQYLATRVGASYHAVITGVAVYGFFAQAEEIPAEGLVHISSLTDDYYQFDPDEHTLYARRSKKQYRLGDRVLVMVARVDVRRRMLDFRLAPEPSPPARAAKKKKGSS